MLVMLAGPVGMLRGLPPEEIAANLATLQQAALDVWRRGHVPVVGVHEAYPLLPHLLSGEDAGAMVRDVSLGLAERCDAVILLGKSEAAEEEVRCVAAHGGLVLTSIDDLPAADPAHGSPVP